MKTTELELGMVVTITSGDLAGCKGKIWGLDKRNDDAEVLIKLKEGTYYCVSPKDISIFANTSNKDEHIVPKKPNTYHDEHYQTDHQPIEVMQANMTGEELVGFLKGNIIKYACRCGRKDAALKEAQKIKRYAGWLVDFLEGKTIDPRK